MATARSRPSEIMLGDGPHCDSGHAAAQVSSEDEAPLPALPRQLLTAAPTVLQQAEELASRLRRLRADEAALRAKLAECSVRLPEFGTECDIQIQDSMMHHRVLQARIEGLEAEHANLRAQEAEQLAEQGCVDGLLPEASAQQEEANDRIQRCMDRLVTLLPARSEEEAVAMHLTEVLEELGLSERRLRRQLCSLQDQEQAARMENRKKALQLSDEQRRTKRLHDTLCQLQSEFFHGTWRPPGCRSCSSRQRPEACKQATTAADPPPPSPAVPPSTGAPPPDEAQAASPTTGADAAEPPREPELRAPDEQLPAAVLPPAAVLLDDRPHEVRAKEPSSPGAGPCGDAMDPVLPLVATPPAAQQAAPGDIAAGPTAETPGAGQATMEQRLRQILEAVKFESLVVRLGHGHYQFGKSVRARVQLRADNQVYASLDGSDYEPVEVFIARMTQPSKAEPVRPKGTDPSWTPPARTKPAGTHSPAPFTGDSVASPGTDPGEAVRWLSPQHHRVSGDWQGIPSNPTLSLSTSFSGGGSGAFPIGTGSYGNHSSDSASRGGGASSPPRTMTPRSSTPRPVAAPRAATPTAVPQWRQRPPQQTQQPPPQHQQWPSPWQLQLQPQPQPPQQQQQLLQSQSQPQQPQQPQQTQQTQQAQQPSGARHGRLTTHGPVLMHTPPMSAPGAGTQEHGSAALHTDGQAVPVARSWPSPPRNSVLPRCVVPAAGCCVGASAASLAGPPPTSSRRHFIF